MIILPTLIDYSLVRELILHDLLPIQRKRSKFSLLKLAGKLVELLTGASK